MEKLLGKFPWFCQGNSKAAVVADSTEPKSECRLLTLVMKYPVLIDQEVLTHRMFARNSESKRAISFEKIQGMVGTDYFIDPIFGKERKGMQDAGPLDEDVLKEVKELYNDYLQVTLDFCNNLNKKGVHHQMVNRYISPFITTCRVMTGTHDTWEYFIKLRDHKDAEPHIQELAKAAKQAINDSKSQYSSIHVPFNDIYVTTHRKLGLEGLTRQIKEVYGKVYNEFVYDAIARCARISYLNYESDYSYEKNKDFIENRLWANEHRSPFEHVAFSRQYYLDYKNFPSVFGNSWFSYRTLLEMSAHFAKNPE